jgi:hypothetical protein
MAVIGGDRLSQVNPPISRRSVRPGESTTSGTLRAQGRSHSIYDGLALHYSDAAIEFHEHRRGRVPGPNYRAADDLVERDAETCPR